MEGGITDSARSTMLRAALARVGRDELKAALDRSSDPHLQIPKAVNNAILALRKHRDPSAAVGTTPYRAALPYVAAAVGDPCLERTIELLGEHAENPTGDQLGEALGQVVEEYPVPVVAVMLASVADAEMPASDLCFGVLAADERFGLTHWSEFDTPAQPRPAPSPSRGATPEQRQERRLKKQRDAEERRKRQAAARQAGEQVRQARKKERSQSANGPARQPESSARPVGGVAPRLTRRALLTPLQEQEYDRQDPWVSGVVFAWIPFDATDGDVRDPEVAVPGGEGGGGDPQDGDGKVRRCVVVAGSPTHLLVRPGYSEGGVKSRDWKSVPLRHWRRSGFDQPTWIGIETVAVPRQPDQAPVGWLSPDDWNSLW